MNIMFAIRNLSSPARCAPPANAWGAYRPLCAAEKSIPFFSQDWSLELSGQVGAEYAGSVAVIRWVMS